MVDAGGPMSVYKSKEVILKGIGSLTFGELSDVDTTNVVLKQFHALAISNNSFLPGRKPIRNNALVWN